MFDIKLFKMHLKDRYCMGVLDDMQGPVDINVGKVAILAKIRTLPDNATELEVADMIGAEGKDFFALYQYNSDNIRYATFNNPFSERRLCQRINL